MSSPAALHDLVCDTAHLLGATSIATDDAQTAWHFAPHDDAYFDIGFDAGLQRLQIVLVIRDDACPLSARAGEMLLRYNSLVTETGGLRMALEGDPGRLVLMLELGLDGLGPTQLAVVLDNMGAVRRAWIPLLDAADGACDAEDEGHPIADRSDSWRHLPHP